MRAGVRAILADLDDLVAIIRPLAQHLLGVKRATESSKAAPEQMPGEYLLRTKVWHYGFSKELHGAHHFVVRRAPKGKVAPKVGDPFLL